MMSSAVDKLEITSALVVLRKNGTFLMTVTAEVQLQAEGTWKTSASSPWRDSSEDYWWCPQRRNERIREAVANRDGKSFRQLTANIKTVGGTQITVIFESDDSEPLEKDMR
jgi:hypothetical protein